MVWSGIRGGCCNPSFWEDRIGGWPLCRRSAKGSKWLAEGPHYICGTDTAGSGVRPRHPQGQTQCESAEARGAAGLQVQRARVRFPAAAVLGLGLA